MTENGREPKLREDRLGASLRSRRPTPSVQFGAALRERLIAAEQRTNRPDRLRTLVAAYVGCGALLLALAAAGAGGGGPFG